MLAVLGLATGLRVATLRAGAPYTTYVDEHFPLKGSAQQISDVSWDPNFFLYPSLLVNATTISALALSTVRGDHAQLSDGSRATIASPYIEVVEPWTLVLAGRLLVTGLAIATVLLVGLLGMRLGGRAVGISAALLVAVLPIFVTRGSIVIVDTPAACFATATLYCAARIASARRERELITWIVLGGVASGLAFTSKYTIGAVLLSVFAVIALRRDRAAIRGVALAAAAAGAFVVSAVISMPALVLRLPEVIDAFRIQERVYSRNITPSYLDQLGRPREVGWLLLVLGVIGLGVLLRARRARPVAIGYLAFAIPTLAVLLRSSYQPLRNLVPLMPFLAIAMATAVVYAVRFVGARLHLAPIAQGVGAVAIVGAVCFSPFEAGTRPYIAMQRALTDTRVTVRRWLAAHVHTGDRVLVAEELAFLPDQLHRICADVVVRSQQRPSPVDDFDWVVFGDLDPIFASPWPEELADRPVAMTTGSLPISGKKPPQALEQVWHANTPLIHIVGPLRAPRPPDPYGCGTHGTAAAQRLTRAGAGVRSP